MDNTENKANSFNKDYLYINLNSIESFYKKNKKGSYSELSFYVDKNHIIQVKTLKDSITPEELWEIFNARSPYSETSSNKNFFELAIIKKIRKLEYEEKWKATKDLLNQSIVESKEDGCLKYAPTEENSKKIKELGLCELCDKFKKEGDRAFCGLTNSELIFSNRMICDEYEFNNKILEKMINDKIDCAKNYREAETILTQSKELKELLEEAN